MRYQTWMDAALADGWAHVGKMDNFGKFSDTDFYLEKDDMVVFLVDRPAYVDTRGRHIREYFHTNGWFDNGRSAWAYFPDEYDVEEIQRLRHVCTECHKYAETLHHVAFASMVCDNCVSDARKKYEFPGWYN